MEGCGQSSIDTPLVSPPTSLSVFEASRLFLQANHSLEHLSKRVRILRRRHLDNGRINQAREGQLQKVICLRFNSTSRKVEGQDSSIKESSLIQNKSEYFEKARNTRETSRCLQQTLRRVRHQDADKVRQTRDKNRQKVAQQRSSELQQKKMRREQILHFHNLLRQHSDSHLNRKLLQTQQEKRSQVEQLLRWCDDRQLKIMELEKEKENLLETCNAEEKLNRSLRATMRSASTFKSTVFAKLRRGQLNQSPNG